MKNDFNLPIMALQKEQEVLAVKKCNEYTKKFGMTLSDAEIKELMQCRFDALKSNGRIEFGMGILPKLIYEFCDSPYIYQDNYVETLEQLQDIFYFFKNESMDELSDDELIQAMKKYFDNECQGSIEYLAETKLHELCRAIRFGNNKEQWEAEDND
ncbi:DUF6323 family protein [Anaeromicropila populeti]|uniref:Uncharacterized protein n=1 Tax=Anaeromicropila populeti TaxID=37658 RepID=A0A1I6JD15_9FIRM|nr:DUF6323 family protein [Anaeromicropila populeti]SFR76789.1 hypothetical protein SAMN05661086_01573 [Anaeromicropila populeti]